MHQEYIRILNLYALNTYKANFDKTLREQVSNYLYYCQGKETKLLDIKDLNKETLKDDLMDTENPQLQN